MASSEVAICNRALQILGSDPILALTDNTNRARQMNIAYVPVRDAELRNRRWKFSIRRTQLAALTDVPNSDYVNAFQLPVDCLRLIEGGDIRSYADLTDYRTGISALYSVENGKVLTNMGAPLHIRYIGQITDPNVYDPSFVEYFSAKLASATCFKITQSDARDGACAKAAAQALMTARQSNALESAPQSIADDTWVTSRVAF